MNHCFIQYVVYIQRSTACSCLGSCLDFFFTEISDGVFINLVEEALNSELKKIRYLEIFSFLLTVILWRKKKIDRLPSSIFTLGKVS